MCCESDAMMGELAAKRQAYVQEARENEDRSMDSAVDIPSSGNQFPVHPQQIPAIRSIQRNGTSSHPSKSNGNNNDCIFKDPTNEKAMKYGICNIDCIWGLENAHFVTFGSVPVVKLMSGRH